MSTNRELGELIFTYPRGVTGRQALDLCMERRDAIYELAERSYRPNRDAEAFEILQRGLYRLNWSQHEFFGWDLVGRFLLNTANEVHEKHIPLVELPKAMNPKEFMAYCKELFWEKTTAKHKTIEFLAEGKGSIEQLKLYHRGLWYRGRSFHTHVALLSVHMDYYRTMAVYKLITDEAGGDRVEKSHGILLDKFIKGYLKTSFPLEEPAEYLASQALWNWIVRCATHPDDAWGVSNLFCMENQAFLEMKKILDGVKVRNVERDLIEFFIIHGEDYDPEGHVERMCFVFEQTMKTPEKQRIALTCLHENLKMYTTLMDTLWTRFQEIEK